MLALAVRNLDENGFAERAKASLADVTARGAQRRLAGLIADHFATVIANPPFFAAGQGTVPGDDGRAAARHMAAEALDQWVKTAAGCAAPGGEVIFIHVSESLGPLLTAFEARFGAVYSDGPGMPPLPTRLMAGLAILKHTFNLSDEELCARWIENPYFQYLCGEEFFCHRLPFDRSSLTRWRQRMGEEKITALLQESLHVAVKSGAMKPSDTRRVVVDTTVQPKNVMFPTDAKLINRAREKLVKLARKYGLNLRQS